MPSSKSRTLRDQALLTLWAAAGVAAATLAGTAQAPTRLALDAAPVDTAFADDAPEWVDAMAELAVEEDGYLAWADARYARMRAADPADGALALEHASIRAEMARRGLPALP
ncbi:hypothetical protein JQC91_00255 [Jannaschia sp. Os4]|uniref:hypothetical protein n=1 Tax=Jannaschia sp. Os4 TaxID=2807617 RepID=UPI0019399029|nr:hypothetical protein [Jannaschia sp. Os4]MBM2574721.1 hypothetical protein [Jannaschia sp. Os4]